MAEIIVDDSRWPILRIRFPAEYTQAEWSAHVVKVLAAARRGQPFVIVNDARKAQGPNAKQREELARSTQDRYFRAHIRAVAIIVDSPVLRAIATAISWISPFPFPFEHVANEHDALEFVLKHLDERRVA